MIKKWIITKEDRIKLDNVLKKEFPELTFEYSKAFDHYYVYNKKTKEKSENISTYELYTEYVL